MARYAESTSVSAEKSRGEIDSTLSRYGAAGFMYGWEETASGVQAMVAFKMKGKHVRFLIPMPDPQAREFTHTPGKGLKRSDSDARAAWEQASRQRWRALALVVKAKLEAVTAGIATFEEEFLAYLVMPDGKTVAAHALPAIERAYSTGTMQRLLPAPQEDAEATP